MKAQRLLPLCPICNHPIQHSTGEHLYMHRKSELVNELLAYMAGDDEEE